eukprot:m.34873 g.34873  ORF g.34873 m.34873 type:complete len:276 (-) comp6564_c0_seq3:1502-2329(-)
MMNDNFVFLVRSKQPGPESAPFNITAHHGVDGRESLMKTSNSLHFLGETSEREVTRPTSNTRKNNPQPKTFRSTRLPSGETVNLSFHDTLDGVGTAFNSLSKSWDGSSSESATSTHRSTFKKPETGLSLGSTGRYGHREKPWVNRHAPSRGILPTTTTDLDILQRTTTTHSDVYSTGRNFHGRTAATSKSRRTPVHLTEADVEDVNTIFTPEATRQVEDWIRSAPGFEGEVIKRMIKSISQSVSRAQTRDGTLSDTSDRVPTPQSQDVSQWSGIQ